MFGQITVEPAVGEPTRQPGDAERAQHRSFRSDRRGHTPEPLDVLVVNTVASLDRSLQFLGQRLGIGNGVVSDVLELG